MGNTPSNGSNSPIILLKQAEKAAGPAPQKQFDTLEKEIQLLFPAQQKNSNQKGAQPENDAMFTYLFTQLLGQHGLQNAEDVKKFFTTEEGRRLKKQLEEMLNDIAAREKAARDRQYYEQLVRHCLMAFLHYYFLQHKREWAKKINETIQQQLDKILSKGKELINTRGISSDAAAFAAVFAQTFQAYQTSAQIIKQDLMQQLSQAEAIEAKLAKLEEQKLTIAERYAALSQHSEVLTAHYDEIELAGSDAEATLLARLKTIYGSSADMDWLEAKSEEIERARLAAQMDLIREKKATLNVAIDIKQEEINKLLSVNKPGNDEAAYKLLHQLNGLNLEYAGLEDMEAVVKGEKVLYDTLGKRVETFKEAEYILPKDQALIKINSGSYLIKLNMLEPDMIERLVNDRVLAQDNYGQFYLINPAQLLNALTPEAKESAKERYIKAAPSITNLKKLVVDNHGLETKNNNQQKSELAQLSQAVQKEVKELNNQLNQIQAAQANLVHAFNNPKPGLNPLAIPVPKPIQAYSKTASSLGASEKAKIFILAHKQNVTQDTILTLKRGFFANNSINNRLAEAQRIKDSINKLEVGKPIPPSTLTLLLRNSNLFSTNPLNLENIREPKPAGSLTPFKTKPSPL